MFENNPVYEAACRLFSDMASRLQGSGAPRPDTLARTWPELEANGFTLPTVALEQGGGGGEIEDELAVLHALGYSGLLLPLAESSMAGACLSGLGLAVPAGPIAVALAAAGEVVYERGRLRGRVTRVPWGAFADRVLVQVGTSIYMVDRSEAAVDRASNLAEEPRDTLRFDSVPAECIASGVDEEALHFHGALLRSAQTCGAAHKAMELTIAYSRTRQQFGKPLAAFQAVQHQVAAATGQLLAAQTMLVAAYASRAKGHNSVREIASARIQADLAAAECCAVGHQVHGALGYTMEYPLHWFTRPMQAWRAEYGNHSYWSSRLADDFASLATEDLWSYVTDGQTG